MCYFEKGVFAMVDTWCDVEPEELLLDDFRFHNFRREYKVQ
jgi:hypothetical protein